MSRQRDQCNTLWSPEIDPNIYALYDSISPSQNWWRKDGQLGKKKM